MSEELRAELRSYLSKIKMPSSPALAAQILSLAEDPRSTVEQFAELIQMDAALAARLLSIVNSAACAQRTPVTTIQRAVTLLGFNRVRTLSLGFQLVSHLDRLGRCPFDMREFWQRSLLRGCVARAVSQVVVPLHSEEAFLVGLLQDCGILLLVQILGQSYGDLYQAVSSPAGFHAAEKEQFPYDHVQMIGILGEEWKLPDAIVRHLERQHTPTLLDESSGDDDRLSAVSYLVGSICLGSTEADDHCGEPALDDAAVEQLGLRSETLKECFDEAVREYAERSELLRGIVPEGLDVTDLLSQANTHLTTSVEIERDRSVREQAQLRTALGEYRDRAARDPLTNILNRGALVETLREAVQRAYLVGQPVTVLFLDLDNFKALNDTFGHLSGDEVLKRVAETLQQVVPNAGVVGRYGGEEFVMAAVGLAEEAAKELAERVVVQMRGMRFSGAGFPEQVTCSVGVAWALQYSGATVQRLIAVADEAMYEAKCGGKNRFCFRSFCKSDVGSGEGQQSNVMDMWNDAVDAACLQDDPVVIPQEFERIARRLNRRRPQYFVDVRKHPRKDLIVPCRLTILDEHTFEPSAARGYVRNISNGGVGLLTTRSLTRGQPAEVAIIVNRVPRFYVAGIVAFCRHVEGPVHEVGMQMFAHGDHPILSHDPVRARRNLDWVSGVLRSIQSSTGACEGEEPPAAGEHPRVEDV